MTKKIKIISEHPSEVLSAYVEISRQFLRSVRIDTDLGREDALNGYICQGTARSLLENMAKQINTSRQRAFTWTGPYGGGKSSLALALCSLVSSNVVLQDKAKQLINVTEEDEILTAFSSGQNGWLVLPVVGRRDSVHSAIDEVLNAALDGGQESIRKPGRPKIIKSKELIARLVTEAVSRTDSGVLLVIDELGKFLESAAQTGDDVYFYQELAEAASRCNGKLIIIGILHQAFEQYASRLGRDARNEWAKVQGRYIDIPLVAGSDEVIELVSRAIAFKKPYEHKQTTEIVDSVVNSIRKHRPGVPKNIDDGLYRCWPLHPITAALLGPISKRRFGQNERSTFGFLASREPIGFTEYLDSQIVDPLSLYEASRYWDYLKANLEPSILSSPDGHRWAVASEAVERAEVRGNPLHAKLVKTIALIELFRNGSGLTSEKDVLLHSLVGEKPKSIESALTDLEKWSIVIYRKHLGAWGIYSGSDFDIEAAIVKARAEVDPTDIKRASELSDLYPVIGKRLYQTIGTMRWFSRSILLSSNLENYICNYKKAPGSSGEFILILPTKELSKRVIDNLITHQTQNSEGALIFGIPKNADRILELGVELTSLEKVLYTAPELEGDGVARKEINARIGVIRSELEEELRDAFTLATWHYKSEKIKIDARKGLSAIASHVAEQIYSQTPIIFSELINRDHISTNAKSALRDLLHRMVQQYDEENLGYEGYPADAGLFYTVLQSSGFHQKVNGQWRFVEPTGNDRAKTFESVWKATTSVFDNNGQTLSLADIYSLWAAEPFGIRSGVMPIIALVYFLANRQHLAMYIEGVFTSELTDANVDEWLQDPGRISFRYVELEGQERELLQGLSTALAKRLGYEVSAEPLDSARGLVAFVFRLPTWSRRTENLSQLSKEVRQLLSKASDPHKVLFNDLPTLFANNNGQKLVNGIVAVIEELADAYPKMLRLVEASLLHSLDHLGDLSFLRQRAEFVKGIMGDFRLEAFTARLSTYDSSPEAIEGLISLATSKKTSDCHDREIDSAILQLGKWAMEFRTVEALANVRGRPASRRAIAVVFGAGQGQSVSDSFDVAVNDLPAISDLVDELMLSFELKNIKRELFLAALAETGAKIVEAGGKNTNG